jgi:hypothetical protein
MTCKTTGLEAIDQRSRLPAFIYAANHSLLGQSHRSLITKTRIKYRVSGRRTRGTALKRKTASINLYKHIHRCEVQSSASIGGLVVKLAVAIWDHRFQRTRPAPGSIPGRCIAFAFCSNASSGNSRLARLWC